MTHMVPSDAYHGAGRTSLRTKQRHRTAAATHVASGAAVQAMTTSTVALAAQRRYHAWEIVGRGGMSEVYRGFDVQLRRPVAIKRLRPDFTNNPAFRARFSREAQSAGRLSHPAIVAIYDTGEERDATGASIPFIVMELVEGRSLRDVLREEGKIPPYRALELTSGVLDALNCSHAAGIIHRDIKPANVMVTDTGGVKVADFGIARPTSDTAGTVTLAGTVVGTPQYLSPEQGRGEPVDARSDIYSVGCMLYELLVGEPPFSGDSPVSIVVQHVSDSPVPPSVASPDVPAAIDSIVLKALAKDPANRYPTALEMKADIERVLGGQQPEANSPVDAPAVWSADSAVSTVVRTGRLNPAHVFAVMTAVLLMVAGASAFSLYRSIGPGTAAASTSEVPAVLGLGKTGAESLLRNASLVPRFEFVHGTEEATVGTVIKQSPVRGATAAINSAVVVMINIGPQEDANTARYPGEVSRSPVRSSSLRSSEKFFAYADHRDSEGAQNGQGEMSDSQGEMSDSQGEMSDSTSRPHRGAHDDEADEKSGKGKQGKQIP